MFLRYAPGVSFCFILTVVAACGDDADPATDAGDASLDASVDATSDSASDSSVDAASDALPAPSAPLTPAAPATTDRFTTHHACAQCHVANDTVWRDSEGRDVSPVHEWQGSMMSFAARDPTYLAALSNEIESNPGAAAVIESTCTRCHAPGAHEELGTETLALDALQYGTRDVDHLARDGVTCAACHQITAEGLGTDASFTGGFVIGDTREIFGPFGDPFATPMIMATGFTPVGAEHMRQSELCASCHTVITRKLDETGTPIGPPFVEQGAYLEWRNSVFADTVSCQSCHMPSDDQAGVALSTAISTRPMRLDSRSPVARHGFTGANSYALELLADNVDWVGTDVPAERLRQRAEETETFARSGARIVIDDIDTDAGEVTVRVVNQTGHKLPTGYPSRRMWIHLEVLGDGDTVLWSSGAFDARGELVGIDDMEHHDRIDSEDQVQVYGSIMGDEDGRVIHLLEATLYLRDNRILPRGWSDTHPDAARTMPVGTDGDTSFMPGSDTVTYEVPLVGAVGVRATLLYQSVTPFFLEGVSHEPTPETERLRLMMESRPPTPTVLAEAEVSF